MIIKSVNGVKSVFDFLCNYYSVAVAPEPPPLWGVIKTKQMCTSIHKGVKVAVYLYAYYINFVCLHVQKLKSVCRYLVLSVSVPSSACNSCCSASPLRLILCRAPSFIIGALRPGHRKPPRPEETGKSN